jgi:hypothetical protein
MAIALVFAVVSLDPPRVLFLLTGALFTEWPPDLVAEGVWGILMRRKKKSKRGII